MQDLLFLAHRIPYPPDKGDKIRSWNILRHLSQRYRVHAGYFVDDPDDMVHVARIGELVESQCAVPLSPRIATALSAVGLLTGEALSARYYRSPRLTRWVDDLDRRVSLQALFAFSSTTAPFLTPLVKGGKGRDARKVILDYVDVDSDKWRQYAANKSWPMSWVYGREARALARLEGRAGALATKIFLVTADEAAHFSAEHPALADRVSVLENGVDTDYFDPELAFERPAEMGPIAFVFTGAMDYWANVDAVTWFVDEVWPRVRAELAGAQFLIVGGKPTADVTALAQKPGVVVTGRVADVRPYLAHSLAVAAPLRIARGVQNKVLEGMAMGRPVIATPQGFEGIRARPGEDLFVEAGAQAFADRLIAVAMGGVDPAMGKRARTRIADSYSWEANLKVLDNILSPESGSHKQ